MNRAGGAGVTEQDSYRLVGVEDAAARLLEKLRVFVDEKLDSDERALLAALLAPGIASAHASDEVAGYGVTGWSLPSLPHALIEAVRRQEPPAGEP